MKDENKTKAELIKELKTLRKERDKSVLTDTTARKQAEDALRESERRFRDVTKNALEWIWEVDASGKYTYASPVCKKILGYKPEELLEKHFYDLFVPGEQEQLKKTAFEVFANKQPFRNFINQNIHKNGKLVWLSTSGVPILDKKGNLLGYRGADMDITESKKVEENIKNIKDELQMILDSVPALIIYKDTEGRIIRTNKTFADSLKVPVKDIVGKTTEELFPKGQAEKMRKDDREVIISGKPKRDIIQPYDTPEGTRWAIIDKMPYKDKEGKVAGVIAFAKDITVQRKSEQKLQQTFQRLKKTMDATIDTMSKIIEAKDPYTSNHQHRVCQLAVPLARELGLPEDKVEGIRIASLIHDIGKIGLPTEILSKPTELIDIEFSLIKGHSQIGYDILKSINFPFPVAQIVLQHHERLNGSGYPRGLKGEKILLEAKIIGVADVVEAMSSFRPYRPALGIDKALEEISKNKGILYDPEVVDACLKLFKEKSFKFE